MRENVRTEAPRDLTCPACARVNPPDARFCAGCGFRFGAIPIDLDDESGGADPLLGRVIAERYRIEELLGRGGMGVVYRVEHVRIGKLMAMKLLHGQLARDKDVVKRFKREAEAASKLDHPNTVQVFDFGQSEGMIYLVMEYLSGRDLGQLIKADGSLPFDRVARIAVQVCGSVSQAHERGIVHRDLKPENIMVLEDNATTDFVKVLDFGLAKLRDTEDMGEKSITRAGSILGTPYYMAPEHIRGESVDARSDVYAMGALMYKAVTGMPPFWASSPVGVLTMHLTDEVVPPSEKARRDVPPEADRILLKAMQKSASDRFQTMDQLRSELLAYLAKVGRDGGLESARLRLVTGAVLPSDSGRQREVATRGDVDDYERRLRTKSMVSYALAALLLATAAAAAAYAWVQRPRVTPSSETEPNDSLGQADPLPANARFRAYLGKRLDENRSDADFYVMNDRGRERRTIRVEVGAIPNMDIVLEIYRAGIPTPLLLADSGGLGQPESVPNFVIEGRTHYLRVRELWQSGRFPTENVSDRYTIRWRTVTPQPNDEHEVNDSLELAEAVRAGETRRGFIGWAGDTDTFCVSQPAANVIGRVDGVPNLDLQLVLIDRTTGRERTIDEAPIGAGERTPVTPRAEPGSLCFQIRAPRPRDGVGNQPDVPYVFHVEQGAP